MLMVGRYWAEHFREVAMETMPVGYEIVDFDRLASVACPCGQARRAFLDVPDFPATIHRTEITSEAKTHYHRRLTETYYFLQCDADAKMALDGKIVPVKPGMCILIRPGVRHRAIGCMTVLIVVFPKFDPADEVVVDEQTGVSMR
jgi:mannose-6-phosphate isomerase-like protein (cupin superfamily)